MDRVFAKKWVNALRSGKYKQCQKTLHDGEGFCCLGVAIDLLGVKWRKSVDGEYYPGYSREHMVLPDKIRKQIGMKNQAGRVVCNNVYLSELNDNGKSFDEIADIIEKNVDDL